MPTTREDDKTGDALKAQRFQMLEDIASELSRKLIFPTCFDLTIRLRELLDDPDVPIEKISAAVSLDPLISSRLLSVANSVLNRRGGPPVKDLQGAVMRIGTKSVRTLALAVAMKQILLGKGLTDFDGISKRLWEHSVRSAAACAVLAQKFGRVTPDQAMFAGLVHDLGASYMLYRATQYEELRERPDTVRHLVYQWHESIGESLLFSLGIPEDIAIATRDHDHPRPVPEYPRNLADIIYIGNVMAGGHFEWMKKDYDAAAQERAKLGETYLALTDEVESMAQELHAALDG
ncbi:HDOD domain-containing protein [Aromatoleum toluvorans]|uniref:HDOD domain-containing protein n=1 Tax=Aromatoleum toluvorans TaxID=92002 RepID=A0ABX1PTT5_9RHOO|nr:HDOD domain-containing protein [Aromatoleum toluvorans]NMG42857.1 HDOD domain-containing protein [Aromatoleum toluvorans]